MLPDSSHGVPPGCQRLEWDSTFFATTIASVDGAALVADAAGVDTWCHREQVACAYIRAAASDQPAIEAAEAFGARLVDVRVILGTATDHVAASHASAAAVRLAEPRDRETLRRIARESHHATRFYVDGRFDRARCDDFYDVWITKSCDGWADAVLVAEVDGVAAGYLTCHRRPEGGQIGLVGVDSKRQGSGAGTAMVAGAVKWFREAGLADVSVATQARNAGGLKLYQKAGFSVRSIELWFHKWW